MQLKKRIPFIVDLQMISLGTDNERYLAKLWNKLHCYIIPGPPFLDMASYLCMLLMLLAMFISWSWFKHFSLPSMDSTLVSGLSPMSSLPDLELLWVFLSPSFLSGTLKWPTRPYMIWLPASTQIHLPSFSLLLNKSLSYIPSFCFVPWTCQTHSWLRAIGLCQHIWNAHFLDRY